MPENMYGRGKFEPSEQFITYMNMIADSPVYSGLEGIRQENGKINWQCSSGKTTSFYKYFESRREWWIKKADELGIPGHDTVNDRLTIAARMIHPTGKKVCLICGKASYIGFMYMNANYAKSWNKLAQKDLFKKGTPIHEATEQLIAIIGKDEVRKIILRDFPEKEQDITIFDENKFEEFFVKTQHIRSYKLSPSFMGDCPHRLDGIHDYCLDCRKENDPGRSDENMITYNHDRRAFQWWSEGNWKIADTLYNSAGSGTCAKCQKQVGKVSPDHIGPLACGFQQDGFFEPLCSHCNDAKNRFFTYQNLVDLIRYEQQSGKSAASWQVKSLWDSTKSEIHEDEVAKTLSNYMRAMQDYFLKLLYYIAQSGHYSFLTVYLHPEYAHDIITFENLDPSKFTFTKINIEYKETRGSKSLAARSVRIAFTELREYNSKPSSKRKSRLLKIVDKFLEEDYPKVNSIISAEALTNVDKSLERIILSEDLSSDEMDSEIGKIIEKPDFANRMNQYKSLMNEIKKFVDSRGKQLADACLQEIKN